LVCIYILILMIRLDLSLDLIIFIYRFYRGPNTFARHCPFDAGLGVGRPASDAGIHRYYYSAVVYVPY
jgi:hypothetical protein